MTNLAAALGKAQSEFPPIERSRDVVVETKKGGTYTFSYAPLDGIVGKVQPVLKANGLSFSQLLDNVDGKPALRTTLLHEGGETLEGICPLPINGEPLGAQEFGSLVTYMRRYALVALLGIATEEDDDGNRASGNTVQPKTDLTTPPEDAKPSEYVIHFGKNRGVLLGSLTPAQLAWYADKWQVQDEPSDYDLRLKAAAVALHSGDDSPMNSVPVDMADVPFA